MLDIPKLLEVNKSGGCLKLYGDEAKALFMVVPHGIINPALIKIDLLEAEKFGAQQSKPWTYLVDTSNVIFPNPLNLLFLRKIKHLPNLGQYVIYAPSLVVQVLGKFTNFIIKPDIVLKNKEQYEGFVITTMKRTKPQ